MFLLLLERFNIIKIQNKIMLHSRTHCAKKDTEEKIIQFLIELQLVKGVQLVIFIEQLPFFNDQLKN